MQKVKKILRVTGIGLLLVLGALQFYRSPRNLGATEGPESIVAREQVPANVRQILARACYDCHSDNTRYPWYAAVQPVAWWLNDHVTEGKSELNFSAFAAYDAKRAVRKLQEVSDEVRERNMPLKSYLLAHPEAKLTDADVAVLTTWAEDLADEIGSR